MKTQHLLTAILWLLTNSANNINAQNYDWTKQAGGTGADEVNSIATDGSGNIYTTGWFEGTVDFNPDAGVLNLTSAGGLDIFITKSDASGALIWAKSIGGPYTDKGYAITTDANGNVLLTGGFRGDVDFDPNAGVEILNMPLGHLTSGGGVFYIDQANAFVLKLDGSGNFIWAKQFGGNLLDFGYEIITDPSGNVYSTGEFSVRDYTYGTADFDPGPGIADLPYGGAYISVLDASGNFISAKQYGGQSVRSSSTCNPNVTPAQCLYTVYHNISIRAMVFDGGGNLVTTGVFTGGNAADFDPGSSTFTFTMLGQYEMFIMNVDNLGNLNWVKQIGGSGAICYGQDVALDASGNIIITGKFARTVDFNPDSGSNTLTSSGSSGNPNVPPPPPDAFVAKYTSSGSYVWAKHFGNSSGDEGLSVACDANGNVYSTGFFAGRVDFNPATGGGNTYNLTSKGGNDIYISKLSAIGNFLWARQMGGTADEKGKTILLSGLSVYTAGYFSGTVDFNPNTGTHNLTSNGGIDAFLHKMTQVSLRISEEANDYPDEASFILFPNPANHKINIQSNNNMEHIEIFDALGKQVYNFNTVFKNENESEINVSSLKPGTYLVKLKSSNQVAAQRLVISR